MWVVRGPRGPLLWAPNGSYEGAEGPPFEGLKGPNGPPNEPVRGPEGPQLKKLAVTLLYSVRV
jgi:hypothetical protein